MRSFLDVPIRNFINYHAGDVSIIAFNSVRSLTDQENIFIEVLLNTTRAIVSLVDLVRENEEQFLQKVMGLCAAAEYSDEITGRHILRVNTYSRFIAGKLGFASEFVETIGRVAALHDIGKVAIPDLIKLPKAYSRDQRFENADAYHCTKDYAGYLNNNPLSEDGHSHRGFDCGAGGSLRRAEKPATLQGIVFT